MKVIRTAPVANAVTPRSGCVRRNRCAMILSVMAVGAIIAGSISYPVEPIGNPADNSARVAQVLTSYAWKVTKSPGHGDQPGEFIFGLDGIVRNSAFSGYGVWTVTGPQSFQISRYGDFIGAGAPKAHHYGFNADLTLFNHGDETTGRRVRELPGAVKPANNGNFAKNMLEVFMKLQPQATAWATLALNDRTSPPAVHEMLNAITEGLKDEAAKSPQASATTYALAEQFCKTCSEVLAIRDQQTTFVSKNDSDHPAPAGRWSEYWNGRVAGFRATFDQQYAQFREALRQSTPPTAPPESGGLGYVDFPPLPSPRAVNSVPPPPPRNPGAPVMNPLDRAAYDHRYIWTWRGTVYR